MNYNNPTKDCYALLETMLRQAAAAFCCPIAADRFVFKVSQINSVVSIGEQVHNRSFNRGAPANCSTSQQSQVYKRTINGQPTAHLLSFNRGAQANCSTNQQSQVYKRTINWQPTAHLLSFNRGAQANCSTSQHLQVCKRTINRRVDIRDYFADSQRIRRLTIVLFASRGITVSSASFPGPYFPGAAVSNLPGTCCCCI